MGVQVLIRSRPVADDFLVRVEGVTEADFDAITNEDTLYELLDNILIMHSPCKVDHQEIELFLAVLLAEYVSERGLGRVLAANALLRLATGRKVAPDVMFLSTAREPTIEEVVHGTADLVIEILSDSTRGYDLGEKRRCYRQARTPEIWFVDPKGKRIVVDVRAGRGYRTRTLARGKLVSSAVAGFWLDLEWLWRRPLPRPLDCLRQILGTC